MNATGQVYSPQLSAMILNAMQAIDGANNGYATLPDNSDLATALRTAGYTVTRGRDLHGNAAYIGYTEKGYRCAQEDARDRRIKPLRLSPVDGPDFEAMILSRNAWAF